MLQGQPFNSTPYLCASNEMFCGMLAGFSYRNPEPFTRVLFLEKTKLRFVFLFAVRYVWFARLLVGLFHRMCVCLCFCFFRCFFICLFVCLFVRFFLSFFLYVLPSFISVFLSSFLSFVLTCLLSFFQP